MTNIKIPIILSTALLSIVVLSTVPGTNFISFADAESEVVVKASKQLQKNPFAMKILAEMEKQKLRHKQQMNGHSQSIQLTSKQIEVEEKRTIAQERLSERLDAFMIKYQDKMPKAAFAKFVEKKPDYIHGVFWGMFDYMQGKVDSARAAMKQVLDDGGSLKEARDAYFAHAQTKRVQLIQMAEDLNVQHGLAQKSVQDTFDEQGKLPRTEA
jgi:hypothetical protein